MDPQADGTSRGWQSSGAVGCTCGTEQMGVCRRLWRLQRSFWIVQELWGTVQCEPGRRRQAGSSDAACAGSGDSGFPSQCVPVLHF